jgi:hypothetical protein
VPRLAPFLRNPFSFLFARTSAEDHVAEYLVREHGRGRPVEEILRDPYVRNRLTPEQQSRMLSRPELIHALGEQNLEAARQYLAERR